MTNTFSIHQFAAFNLITIIVAIVILGLFRLRPRFGLAPLYITLGIFQPIQVLLASSIYAEILPGVLVSPGSVIMFSASLFAILLVYIREDAIEARKIIYGIMFANMTMSLLLIIFGWQLRFPNTFNFLNLSPDIFNQNTRVTLAGTIALFADVLLIIFVYEAFWRWVTKKHFFCIYLTMALILVFDTLVFATGAFYGQENYVNILTSGMLGKLFMAVPFAIILTLYLYYGEHVTHSPQSFDDIFNTLSYRQKYELVSQRSEEAEKMLQISKDRFQHIFENSPVPLWEEDFTDLSSYLEEIKDRGVSDFRAYFKDHPEELITCSRKVIIKDINQETIKLHNAKDKEELLGNLDKIFTDTSYTAFKEEVIALAEGKSHFETEGQVKTLDGDTREVSLKLQLQPDSKIALLATTDITERKLAEMALRESEARYREIFLSNPQPMWVYDLESLAFLAVNDAAIQHYGYSREDFLGMTIKDIRPPEDIPRLMENVSMITNGFDDAGEWKHAKKDGSIISVEITSHTLDFDGHAAELVLAQDITKRKQIQDSIIEEKNKLEAFLAALNDGVTVQDTNFQILYQNDVHREKQGDHIGEFCYQAYQNKSDICPGCLLVKCFEDGGIHRRETQAATDKGILYFEVSASPIKNAQGKIVAAIETIRDITDKKKLERQLVQTQKMESVGQLAGGVAHDFNNMLGVIMGYTELVIDQTTPDDPRYKELQEIYSAARRSADITRQLLAFARKQTIDPRMLDLNETIDGMLTMLRRLIGEDIDISWQPDSDLAPVFMDPSQLDQILANLCVNSRDAIDGTGKLTIETHNVSLDENYCADRPGFKPGNFVMLAVSDNGRGMDKETQNKLFEPFFTTKGIGEGTGLGLSTVYGIVKQNNGFINVYSELNQGTTFKIYLPGHEGEVIQSMAQEVTELPRSKGETVLVVEDEVSILKLAKQLLVNLDYKVLEAATPDQAVDDAEKYNGQIHLLITDVVMPQMNGRDLADKLQEIHPDLKVLFMSGYTANVIAHHGILDKKLNFIQKPFSNQDLAVKVRRVLDGTSE